MLKKLLKIFLIIAIAITIWLILFSKQTNYNLSQSPFFQGIKDDLKKDLANIETKLQTCNIATKDIDEDIVKLNNALIKKRESDDIEKIQNTINTETGKYNDCNNLFNTKAKEYDVIQKELFSKDPSKILSFENIRSKYYMT